MDILEDTNGTITAVPQKSNDKEHDSTPSDVSLQPSGDTSTGQRPPPAQHEGTVGDVSSKPIEQRALSTPRVKTTNHRGRPDKGRHTRPAARAETSDPAPNDNSSARSGLQEDNGHGTKVSARTEVADPAANDNSSARRGRQGDKGHNARPADRARIPDPTANEIDGSSAHPGRQEEEGRSASTAAPTQVPEPSANDQPVVAERAKSSRQSGTGRGRGPRGPERTSELQNARARSKQLEDELLQVQEDRRIGLQREEDLRCALKEAEKRLQALKAECTAARVFGEIEDAEGKVVLDLFGDVVEGINDLAFCVWAKLDEAALTSALVLERAHELKAVDHLAERHIHPFLVLMVQAKAKVESVALTTMQCMAFSVLVNYVFHPLGMTQGVPKEVEQYMTQLRSRMASLEPQEQYGRWRAMTYSAMRAGSDNTKLAQFFVEKIMESLGHVFTALSLPSVDDNGAAGLPSLTDVHNRTTKVVLDAMKLQDMMQRVYVSHDYSVFFALVNGPYLASEMEITDVGPDTTKELADAVQQTNGSRGTVLLSVIPGLRARRIGMNLSHKVTIVRKASVIALL